MRFIKKNSSTIVAILVFIVVFVGIFAIKKTFAPDESSAIYGNRLEGRDAVTITKSTKDEVKKALSDASSVDVRVAGRIVDISIKVNGETNLADAKKLGDKALEQFTKAEKKYYDFQFFINKNQESNQFPIIGYKHHTKDKITWTKDRAES